MSVIKFFPVYLIILMPIFANVIGGSGASQFLINSVIFILIFFYLGHRKIDFFKDFHLLFFLYIASFFFILLSSIIYEAPLARTLSDAGRLALFALFLHCGFHYQKHFKLDLEHLSEIIIKLGIVSIAFSSLVYFDFFHVFIDFFKGRQSTEEYLFHFYRFSGFHGYPTDFSVFLNFCILLTYFKYERGEFSFKKTIILIILFILGIVLSFARGGMLQLALLIFLIFLLSPIINFLKAYPLDRQLRFKYGAFFSITLFSISLFFIFINFNHFENDYLSYIFSVFSSDIDSSIAHRFNELQLVQNVLINGELVPLGQERLTPFGMDTIEGLYSHYVLRYGWAGLILILTLYIVKLSYLYLKKENNSLAFSLFWWFTSFIIILAPFSDVSTRLKGLSFYSFLLGVALFQISENSQKWYQKFDSSLPNKR